MQLRIAIDITYVLSYTRTMQRYEWNEEKNVLLKSERKISFEDVVSAVQENRVLADRGHPKRQYAHQRVLIVNLDNYAYVVPYVITDKQTIFLKTIIPSRVETKKYLRGEAS